QALKHYLLAADQEQPEALFALGLIYQDGNGVDKDPAMALQYFRRSANSGFVLAEKKLLELERENPAETEPSPDGEENQPSYGEKSAEAEPSPDGGETSPNEGEISAETGPSSGGEENQPSDAENPDETGPSPGGGETSHPSWKRRRRRKKPSK
ncbi:MAG: hypothetical protein LBF38_12505, partial [Deltaproteobacteria bacterium]|nr:hypothetical protein [Deltaproteobacteria bacterium]